MDGEYKGLYTYAIHVIGGETTEGAQDRGLETQMNNKNVIYPLGKKEKWLLKITTRKFIFLWFSDCPVPEFKNNFFEIFWRRTKEKKRIFHSLLNYST